MNWEGAQGAPETERSGHREIGKAEIHCRTVRWGDIPGGRISVDA